MQRIVRVAIVVLALAFCVWAYFAPHLTVRSMRLAAERGDAEALAAHVDFPAVRDSLKQQLAARVDERIGGSDGGAFGALGARLANAIAEPMIDAVVSPESLSLVFAGRGLARDGLAAATLSDPPRDGGGIALGQWDAHMGYEDISTFVVTFAPGDHAGVPARLVFKRHHLLWWRLSGVDLPAGF